MKSLFQVKYLVSKGATINVYDKKGENPISRAPRVGNKETVELLIQHGALVNLSASKGNSTSLKFTSKGTSTSVKFTLTNSEYKIHSTKYSSYATKRFCHTDICNYTNCFSV